MAPNETSKSMRNDKTAKIVIAVLAFMGIVAAIFMFNQNSNEIPSAQQVAVVEDMGKEIVSESEFPPMPNTPQGEMIVDEPSAIEPAAAEAEEVDIEETNVEDVDAIEENAAESVESSVAQEESPVVAADRADSLELDLDRILSVRAVGDPNAPIRIDEFASLSCSHCADFHTQTYDALKEKYIDTGQVYFVFNDFPLNKPALDASITARCLPEARYESFVNLLFKTQRQWLAEGYLKALRQNSKLAGLSDEAFDTCLESEEILKGLEAKITESRNSYDIASTPTFIFNKGVERIGGSASLATFDQVIAKLLAQQGAE